MNKNSFTIYNFSWTKNFVEKNISIIEDNYKKYPNKNKWSCNCHVVHDNDKEIEHIDFNFLRKQYEVCVKEVVKLYNIKKYHIGDIWYNYFKKSQFQELHRHKGNGLTAVHYLIYDPKYHSKTEFTNNIKSPEIKEGNILFFPSNLQHYVPKNNSNKPRLTVAFSIRNKDNEN